MLIYSNFTGADVVLFGSVERDAQTVARRGGYDIVVTVTGPREDTLTFRKERVFGILVNADSRTFVRRPRTSPCFRTVRSPTSPTSIPSPDADRTRPHAAAGDFRRHRRLIRDDPFRQAFLRLKVERNLYRETQNGVTFLTPALYRAAIPIPDNAPTGYLELTWSCSPTARCCAHADRARSGQGRL